MSNKGASLRNPEYSAEVAAKLGSKFLITCYYNGISVMSFELLANRKVQPPIEGELLLINPKYPDDSYVLKYFMYESVVNGLPTLEATCFNLKEKPVSLIVGSNGNKNYVDKNAILKLPVARLNDDIIESLIKDTLDWVNIKLKVNIDGSTNNVE